MTQLNKPIVIAQIIGKWVGGGVESVIMNYYRNIDKSEVQFDFICDNDSTDIPYKEIEKLGGKVILIPPYQKIFKYHRELKKVLKDGNYKIVHSHINTLSVFSLFAAKCAGVPIRIAHSHSTTNKKEWKKNLLKIILRPLIKLFATDYMACTEHAGRWMFGDRQYEKGNVYLLNNAIDLEKFKYDETVRKEKRKELGIENDTFVIGHVGRFVEQKNHKFLIDIFNELYKSNKKVMLLLVGQGPLMDEIKEKVKTLRLDKCVKFLGQRQDINDLYQAMDLFLFPSLYEGLGMVMIEAQCSGLQCICSTEVPKIVKITDKIYFIDLKESYSVWVSKINECIKKNNIRTIKNEITKSGYDIRKESYNLISKYKNLLTNNIYNYTEFLGIPACGKSYYVNNNCSDDVVNINKKCLTSKCRFIRNIKKVIYSIYLIFLDYKIYFKTINFIKQCRFKRQVLKIKMFLYLTSTLFIIYKYGNKHISYFEEGLLQVLFGICYCSVDYKNIPDNYINIYRKYFSGNVIFLDTSLDIIEKRLLERNIGGGSELEHDIKKDKESINRAKDILDIILQSCKRNSINYKTILQKERN